MLGIDCVPVAVDFPGCQVNVALEVLPREVYRREDLGAA